MATREEKNTEWLENVTEKFENVEGAIDGVRRERKRYAVYTFGYFILVSICAGLVLALIGTVVNANPYTGHAGGIIGLVIWLVIYLYATITFGQVLGFKIYKNWLPLVLLSLLYIIPGTIYVFVVASKRLNLLESERQNSKPLSTD